MVESWQRAPGVMPKCPRCSSNRISCEGIYSIDGESIKVSCNVCDWREEPDIDEVENAIIELVMGKWFPKSEPHVVILGWQKA